MININANVSIFRDMRKRTSNFQNKKKFRRVNFIQSNVRRWQLTVVSIQLPRIVIFKCNYFSNLPREKICNTYENDRLFNNTGNCEEKRINSCLRKPYASCITKEPEKLRFFFFFGSRAAIYFHRVGFSKAQESIYILESGAQRGRN